MLARLFLVPLGLVLAAAVEIVFLPFAALFDPATRMAGFALGHAAFFALLDTATGGDGDAATLGAALSAGFVAICLLPLLIVVLMGETFGVASGLWYVLGTGGLAALMPFVLRATEGNAPLHALRDALADRLRGVGLGRFAADGFEPHVTLAYDTRLVPTEAVAPVAWTAREFVLVHSLLGQTRHIPLARWPLG